ncbi:MAG: GMC family oxidoreductase [Candidatus Accumulibacter sp.]|uniref:GMC family oxidoreductase n=1 Tax=Candidatus Accumulibacter affinis TaxID=2954384 RepID=A0A935TB65_9PROT|nr:GMC family oxidoreductase [Candidatus Accumulibacter affinis]MBP9804956.1 GMC family oxidoreductase [Accumulibacter sp.]
MLDPIRAGLAGGWKHIDAATLTKGQTFEADVVIIGTGAGGGVTADILSDAGLRVVLVEEGPLRSSSDFKMREADAYPQLYQESASRKTADKAINIYQGRCVGGSTTVNWTSSFRTPPEVFEFWQHQFGLRQLSAESMSSWFAVMEHKLSIRRWETSPNANNQALAIGGEKLGIPIASIKRNVKGCWNLGYCGMGCPTNAKQSMLVTTIPAALNRGATLYTRLRAERLRFAGGRVTAVDCMALQPDGIHPAGKRVHLRARHFVIAGGAIGSPALLLRSGVPDPYRRLGKRTFLHPVVISSALMPERVDAYAGAPQTIYSDHFLHQAPIDGPLGFKLEVPPLHPVLLSTTLQGYGEAHARLMREFTHVNALLALLRDGFNPDSRGGQVGLDGNGLPVLDYPIHDVIWDAARRALLAMAEIQFAAGARWVSPAHESAPGYASWAEAKKGIAELPLKPLVCRVVSAHVMGGCGMADAPQRGVVDHRGRHFWLGNLSVHDGSLFPTSLGVNPQLSIYGLVARNASLLAAELSGRPVPLIP